MLTVITAAHALGSLSALAVAPLAPFLLDALGLSRIEAGLLLPAVYLGGILVSLPAGWLTERFGVRWPLVVGLSLALVVREFWPSHARAGDAIENLAPRNLIFRVGEEAAPTSWSERMGRWSSQHLSNLPGVTTPRADLDLLGITTTRFYTDKTLWALIGLIFPGLLGVFSVVLDLPLPWPVFPDGITPLPYLPDGQPDWAAARTGVPSPGARMWGGGPQQQAAPPAPLPPNPAPSAPYPPQAPQGQPPAGQGPAASQRPPHPPS